MDFKKWLLEGQALALSQDMANFAKEAAKLAYSKWEYNVPLHRRQVSNDKYGTKLISVVPRQRPEGDNGFGTADIESGEISVYLVPNKNINIEEFIQHELIHMFDPKLTNPNLKNAKWGLNRQNPNDLISKDGSNDKYYTQPWEQDAFMRQTALATIKDKKWLYDNKNDLIKSLSRMQPQDEWEIAWSKNPKMWRKYLNTIYQLAINS